MPGWNGTPSSPSIRAHLQAGASPYFANLQKLGLPPATHETASQVLSAAQSFCV
jgi:hypothetical protein